MTPDSFAAKSRDPRKRKTQIKPQCLRCDNTLLVCNICGESETACGCSAHEVEAYQEEYGFEQFEECPDCCK